ncbi:hypothetical protein M877_39880 (plasmid) [Streptomyces niveus NCIMB 11891]|nr:hypothetical protein M877_39880 [Streptomyces niveus NCIMB 11891]
MQELDAVLDGAASGRQMGARTRVGAGSSVR